MANSKQLNDPLYQNWIKAGLALKLGKDIISDFLGKSIEQLTLDALGGKTIKFCHSCTLLNILPCPTNGYCHITSNKNCKKHDINDVIKTHRPCPSGVCHRIFNSIKEQFASAKGPLWSQSDPTLWCSNVWEIAKLFMPVGYQDKHDIEEYDFSGLMNIIINCKFIQKQLSRPFDVKFYQKVRLIISHLASY